jgi:hypothetical protein
MVTVRKGWKILHATGMYFPPAFSIRVPAQIPTNAHNLSDVDSVVCLTILHSQVSPQLKAMGHVQDDRLWANSIAG